MERIVITGATGFLGSNLAELFLEKGAAVYVIVRPQSKKAEILPVHENLHVIQGGIADINNCVEAIGHADGFFHFAWGGVNREEIDSPEVQRENVEGSLECVRAAKKLGCSIFMDAGSRVEYGVTDSDMSEDLPCRPVNEYGKAKLTFYQEAKELCRELGMSYYHLRFFSVYGIGDHPWSMISTLVRELPKGNSVSLSACLHKWNFMYIKDAVEAVYDLYQTGKEREAGEWIVNVASEDTRILRSFVEDVWELAGEKGQPVYGEFKQAKEGALSICPAVSRLSQLTGNLFKERYSFREGISEMMKKEVEQ